MNNIGNRNSTPESSISNLRPPASRSAFGSGHVLRSSADMGPNPSAPMSARGIRPASEVIHGQRGHGQSGEDDGDKVTQQWLQDIGTCEDTLEEMAAATLDQDFKDELSAIEQWFRVLSEAERTAALYALLQQATQVQTRFFIGVLQQMAKGHPTTGMLSPSTYGEKDPMSNRLSSAMSRLSVEGSRHSITGGRPPPSPGGGKRVSGLEQAEINSMFPDAAAAIAKQKADYTHKTGTEPRSNRSSAFVGERASMIAPGVNAPQQEERRKESFAQGAQSPWAQRPSDNPPLSAMRPKSSSGQPPMGQFAQPPPSAGLRQNRPANLSGDNNIQSTSLNAPEPNSGMNILSPYQGNWSSLAPTPMDANFNTQNTNQANMVANATAMKLAALSTVTNRVQLDDVRKYRRARSSDNNGPQSPGLLHNNNNNMPSNFVMTNEHGQVLTPQQVAALQAQQLAAIQGSRSRPISPSLLLPGQDINALNMGMNTNNGFLSAYGQNSMGNGMTGMNMSQYSGLSADNFLSDAGEIQRGRSPRGKRGTSRPPEDPTDIELLKDIPNWLRSLRLHKYTDNLKDIKWQDLVQLDEKGLEDRGVLAKGARTKMLKVFEDVRQAQAQGKL